MILAFLLMPFAARYLGDERYGAFGLASTLMYFVLILSDFGVNTYVIREVAKNRKQAKQYCSNAFFLKLILLLVAIPLLLLYLSFAGYNAETNLAILIFAFYGIISSFVQLATGIFRAFERMEFETIVLIVEKVITTGLGILVLAMGFGLTIFCSVFAMGGLISLILSGLLLKKRFCWIDFNISRKFMFSLLRTSFAFGISMILSTVYGYTGVLMLSIMTSQEEVGWYWAAFRFLSFTNFIPTILATALFPALSREIVQSKERFSELFTKGMKYLSFLAFPLVAGTILLSKDIILLVFGDEYFNSIIAIQILVWVAGLLFFNIFLVNILKAANHQKSLVNIQIIGLIINITLNLLLIPRYSYIGASITTVITEVLMFLFAIIFIFKRVTKIREVVFLPKVFAATAIMTVFVYFFRDYNIFAVITAAIVVYFLSLYLLKGFVIQDFLLINKAKKLGSNKIIGT